jgi:ubiquinone/menaquinone biosynthesis C-methylase UbiE
MVSDMNRAKQIIAASYDRSAAGFSDFADRLVYTHLASPLAAALARISGPILDVACGSGALGRLLEDVVETDISHAQLANNRLSRRVVADAERLPFADGAFAGAGCAFGINHFPDPTIAVKEMARVAGLVGLITWQRPDEPFAPKEIVLETIAAHAGNVRTHAGELVEEMTQAMGSTRAVEELLAGGGLDPEVETIQVDIPWPGADAFIDYRLAMVGVLSLLPDPDAVRHEAKQRIEALPETRLAWRPRLVMGIGRGMPTGRSIRVGGPRSQA